MLTRQLQQQTSCFALRISSFFLFLIFSDHDFHHVNANMGFIYAGCSQDRYQQTSAYEINLNSLLSSIVTSASQSMYDTFTVGNDTSDASPEAVAFGLYQCRGDLKMKDCTTCIATLVAQIELVCPYTYGASLQLDGCYVRYEHDDFLGKLDTTLRYKKCSNSLSHDQEFLKRRDDVLADLLQAAPTGFRMSSADSVEGYAQCYGDLTVTDCSSCLSVAIMQMKSLCGSSAAADVFLAKCYARYWASGYYDSSDSYKHDDVGKTVAIIVGVVAGVALIIVLLSLCRSAVAK